ncbi:ABC transporter ATP-binding protein [Chelatococcus asaccharovorans]|uniref:Peptide/nickel transport system ATP-binding protein/oligopeptide transport system ATP-binding protein n=1 Tax=Chelatococcus asaccharovorans TaxID=28210 RepID=A0A2V3ULA4_9HYPH|nr:ABC transporter ATP-binding protein [Chelatococcus asaccharovorans]MBS7705383.1 ABC transporter ATP-binding protein [Chelatococcus asaccharovorans]PXW60212.1 peptide/nickel transport system ATP-binding protein/oligopeptide transport system ATP-binding protein [Chelatococcus asaccharovorans]
MTTMIAAETRATAGASFEVDGLTVRFSGKTAVDNVSFRVAPGEALGIVGESGSGKSTTAMGAVGLLDPEIAAVEARHVRLDMTDLRGPGAPRAGILGRRIGVVFQNPMVALNPVLTIERQLTDHMRQHLHLDARAARARAIRLLGEVGITDAARRLSFYPFQFSGGMLQRITIAMALACDPELLIADEPTTALDATVQAEVVDLILSIRRSRGLSLIWITHDLALLNRVADRVAVMYAGRLVEIGPADVLLDHPAHPYAAGLLASVQSLWTGEGAEFLTIEGAPPPNGPEMPGCAFAPRCPRVFDRCATRPPMASTPADAAHGVACWLFDPKVQA